MIILEMRIIILESDWGKASRRMKEESRMQEFNALNPFREESNTNDLLSGAGSSKETWDIPKKKCEQKHFNKEFQWESFSKQFFKSTS